MAIHEPNGSATLRFAAAVVEENLGFLCLCKIKAWVSAPEHTRVCLGFPPPSLSDYHVPGSKEDRDDYEMSDIGV